MGLTMAERILSEHVGEEVRAGQFVVTPIDLLLAVDSSAPLAIRQMGEMGLTEVKSRERIFIFHDHTSPSPRRELSNEHAFNRRFADEQGIRLYDVGEGISHQVMAEQAIAPGYVIVGADSHTPTSGAMGAFAVGMGSTDLAVAMALGKTWLRVPETIKVELMGTLPKGTYAKDVALHLIHTIGAAGALYKAVEFHGDLTCRLGLSDRMTLTNLTVEAGAKTGMVPSDEVTRAYLVEQGRGHQYRAVGVDSNARYERVVRLDCNNLRPMIACPHVVDNVKPIDEIKGLRIHQVFIGTCTNGRLEDLAVAAELLRGRKVHPRTRLVVTPASKQVLMAAMKAGIIESLLEAGAVLNPPGCGACAGAHQGVLADGENCLATQSRNFKGRMGNPDAFLYLGSSAVAAATAVAGEIADPKELM